MKIAKIVSPTIILLTLFLAIFLLAEDSYSAVPKKINYQGYITNSEGTPLAGNVEMTFSIYETDAEGAAVWTETLSVEVTDGIFSVILGETNPLESLTDRQYYLGIKVGTDDEMTPRKTLASVISSIISEKAIQATTTTCNPGDSIICYTGSNGTMFKGLCKPGQRYCNSNGTGYGNCIGEELPQSEVCDGIDNDCDGMVNEGVRNACGNCGAVPVEVCDGLDNDCDGSIDNGIQLTDDTSCDGKDDDCDGIKDDDYIATQTTCGIGACARTGLLVCQNGAMATVNCTPGSPLIEGPMGSPVCSDGIDNDCDATTDGVDLGCTSTCIPTASTDVTCNGVDENCSGVDGEGYGPGTSICGVGVCNATGQIICQNGAPANTCTPKTPTENPEVTCNNGLDDDCDGFKDVYDTDCRNLNYAIDFTRTSEQALIKTYRGNIINGIPFTIETWVKKKTDGVLNGNVFSSLIPSWYNTSRGLSLYVKNSIPKIFVGTSHATSTQYYLSCGDSLLTNIWTHIVAILTNENHSNGPNDCSTVGAEQPHTECYVDGELKNCGSTNLQFIDGSTGETPAYYMGMQNVAYDGLNSDTKFAGAIDDVRLWTVARTQSEIQQCMNQTLGSSEACSIDPAKLGAYWPLNEGSGSWTNEVIGGFGSGGSIEYLPYYNPWSDGWIPGYPLVLP